MMVLPQLLQTDLKSLARQLSLLLIYLCSDPGQRPTWPRQDCDWKQSLQKKTSLDYQGFDSSFSIFLIISCSAVENLLQKLVWSLTVLSRINENRMESFVSAVTASAPRPREAQLDGSFRGRALKLPNKQTKSRGMGGSQSVMDFK